VLCRMLMTLSDPNYPQTTTISTFFVAFHILLAGNRRDFEYGTWVESSKSQPTYDKASLKWTWSRHVI